MGRPGKPERVLRRKKEHADLRLSMNKNQRDAWNVVIPVLKRALRANGRDGRVLEMYRELRAANPDAAATVRVRTQWLDELLDALGEK